MRSYITERQVERERQAERQSYTDDQLDAMVADADAIVAELDQWMTWQDGESQA